MSEKTEVAQELLELLEQARPLARRLGELDPYFHAYSECHFEGKEAYLGGNFVIDVVRGVAEGDEDEYDEDEEAGA